MVYGLLVFVHVLVCVFLVIVVLLQSGKAADLAGAFGGMGSQTAFGPRGTATLLSKLTRIAATLFMVTSLTLAIMATRGTGGPGTTVLEEMPSRGPQPVHATPAAPGRPTAPVEVQVPGPGGQVQTIPIRPSQKLPTAPEPAPAAPAKK
ncbi:MAG TPA: preprotein translocase subunit SecG [Bryobacteraceae bacterium]|nr:preprotein translocase subunit SecG [Bryobacteraceae bacterium]